ncbi:MAG TPA: purine nucleoside permease [Acidobacteriaceae bacterium]|nr:purine nucleoside permease [Acidobacteriaceae bacterium]
MSTRWLAFLLAILTGATAHAARIPVKVVVVALYESDTTPGEYHHWVERDHLDRVYPFPQGFHDLRMNDQGVLGILTGVGTARAAASIMALGLDPRFDLSKAYWLVAGIAGADPQDASLGSAVWAQWVVDGDLAFEIDAREIPPQWSTGYVPLGKKVPYEEPKTGEMAAIFHLNPTLQQWAFEQTKNVKLDDSPELQAARAHFAGANARRPPFVLKGDVLASSTFWHGKLLDQWANNWVKYQTDSKGQFVTSAMEDSGILQSLTFLQHAGRVDLDRVMVLRTVSNYDQPAVGSTAAESLSANAEHRYSAYFPALEAAYRVGNVVVSQIVTNWNICRDQIPGASKKDKP